MKRILFLVFLMLPGAALAELTPGILALTRAYSQQIQARRETLQNPQRPTGHERYQLAYSEVDLGADENIAKLLIVAQEQEKIVKQYIDRNPPEDIYEPISNNELIVDAALAVLKNKIKLTCKNCKGMSDWFEYGKTVEAYFDIFDVKDSHAGFSGLPFAKLMEINFFQDEFQNHVTQLYARLNAVIDRLSADPNATLETNLFREAIDSVNGDRAKAVELLGLMTSRDILISRYLKYMRTNNPQFMEAFAMIPVLIRLITELDQKKTGTKIDRFSYDGQFLTQDERSYYFWSSALASKKLIDAGFRPDFVESVALEFPRQYKVIRYFEQFGFVRGKKWLENFKSNSKKAFKITGRGKQIGDQVSDENQMTEKTRAYLQSLTADQNVENELKKVWLKHVLENGVDSDKAAVLYYDFASSRIGLSHIKLFIGDQAFEIHRFKNSNGTYLRERPLLESLLDSKPGALPSGILEFSLSETQRKSLLSHLRAASGATMKYSFVNKVVNAEAFNCAGVIYESMRLAGLDVARLRPLDGFSQQIFQRMTKMKNSRLLGKDGRWRNNFVWPNVSEATITGSTVKVNKDLKDSVGFELLQAEQGLSSKTPFLSNLRNVLGLFFPFFRSTGTLAEKYQPKNAQSFDLISFLLKPDEVEQILSSKTISEQEKKISFPQIDGQEWVRFFIHPNERENYKELIAKSKVDPVQWLATPSASPRSLYVQDKERQFPVFMVKTSLSIAMGGASRIIDDERAARSVFMSDMIQNILTKSEGKLPSGKTWELLREPVSILPDKKSGGYILRTLIPEMNNEVVLPILALISKRDASDTWLEELYRYSGYKSKADFAFNEFVSPLVELHSLFSIQNGITTEFHQQNVLVKIDPITRKIKGFIVKDMDAHWLDHSLRKNRLGLGDSGLSLNEKMAYLFRFGMAQENQFKSYSEILRTRSFEWILKYFLNRKELKETLTKADQIYLTAFNRQFPEFAAEKASDLPAAWSSLHKVNTTQAEAEIYSRLANENGKKRPHFILEAVRKFQTYFSLKKISDAPALRATQCRDAFTINI